MLQRKIVKTIYEYVPCSTKDRPVVMYNFATSRFVDAPYIEDYITIDKEMADKTPPLLAIFRCTFCVDNYVVFDVVSGETVREQQRLYIGEYELEHVGFAGNDPSSCSIITPSTTVCDECMKTPPFAESSTPPRGLCIWRGDVTVSCGTFYRT